MVAADLGRDAAGQWRVISDRTQAPSGLGYAMENRRVVSRVLPELYREAGLHRLAPFFRALRLALLDAAPTPGRGPAGRRAHPRHPLETAFDQAFLASLLGLPAGGGQRPDRPRRPGLDAGRCGRLEQVDVILRRVDPTGCDPLELRPGSQLGVAGLVEASAGARSASSTASAPAAGEPACCRSCRLCEALLGEHCGCPSVDTWWCGDDGSLSHVLANLDVAGRPADQPRSRSQRPRRSLARRAARPAGATGSGPRRTASSARRCCRCPGPDHRGRPARPAQCRAALVRGPQRVLLHRDARRPGAGDRRSRARSRGVLVTDPDGGLAKDVWVVGQEPVAAARIVASRGRRRRPVLVSAVRPRLAMVPRVLSDLFWFGRYAERAEDLLRLVLATRTLAIETDLDVTQGRALEVLLQAVPGSARVSPASSPTGSR